MRVLRAFVLALLAVLMLAGTTSAYWPVGTRSSYVSQWYSYRHRAVDIAAYCGARIFPAASGRVVFAGWRNNGGGYQVWVSHGSGRYTAYYHMRREVTAKGRYVYREKTVIGYVGATGYATGCHTHVEAWHGWPWGRGSYRYNPWFLLRYGYYLPYRYR